MILFVVRPSFGVAVDHLAVIIPRRSAILAPKFLTPKLYHINKIRGANFEGEPYLSLRRKNRWV
jgi:hypothetical protein